MADITINHIAGLEVGGHLAKSILAAEANFHDGTYTGSASAWTVTNKAKTSGTVTLTVPSSHGIAPGQVLYVNLTDLRYDGIFKVTTTAATTCSYIFGQESCGSSAVSVASGATRATITNKAKTSNTATLTFNTSHGMFPNQNVTVSLTDANFDGTFPISATGATTIDYVFAGGDIGSATAAGSIVGTYAGNLRSRSGTQFNAFPEVGTITGAGDVSANKIILTGRRAVYYTGLTAANPNLTSDSVNQDFALTMWNTVGGTGNIGSPQVGCGFIVKELNSNKCLYIEPRMNGAIKIVYFDGTTVTILTPGTHYVGDTSANYTYTVTDQKNLWRTIYKKNASGKLARITLDTPLTNSIAFTVDLMSTYQLTFPLQIGDGSSAGGVGSSNDLLVNKQYYDLVSLELL